MSPRIQWKKSSFSGGGEGNDCVEVASLPLRISVRDSKTPVRATLSFSPGVFTVFVDSLKTAEDPSPC
ncbi:DUF397 domain-containing protein [Streptomyces sp. NPDC021356]|uniref:DUF397 domain-containing protein n=1 Tax=Streptomyces sp. NPDC021356 TaxID=3154900 RepID=UPI0033FD061E